MNRKKIYALVFAVTLTAAAAIIFFIFQVKKPVVWTKKNSLRQVSAPKIEDAGQVQSLLRSLDFSLKYLETIPPATPVDFGPGIYTINDVKESIADFRHNLKKHGLSPDFFKYIKHNYIFYKSACSDVLFTGYYEARLQGSLTPAGSYRYPIYRKPTDLYQIDLSQFPFFQELKTQVNDLPGILRARIAENNMILPYYSRSEIETAQKLAGEKLEIAWCNDPVAVFFLQIQGSGVIELDTGEILRVNYADSNGHPYRAIGRLLIDRGILTPDNVSMQTIREYLKNHPAEMAGIFNYNPSYVFFRVVEEGPLGFIQVPLTPYRSIALDRELFPGGALCYIETELPFFDKKGKLKGWKKFRGFVLNQDTGGAIRSPARVDLFTGRGEESELTAGHLKREGTFYFLLKK